MAAAAPNGFGADSKFRVATAELTLSTLIYPLSNTASCCAVLSFNFSRDPKQGGIRAVPGAHSLLPGLRLPTDDWETPSGDCPTTSGLESQRSPSIPTVSQPEPSASLESGGILRRMESPTRRPGRDPLRCWVQCHGGRSGSRCYNCRRLSTELQEAPPVSTKEPGAPELESPP